MLLSGGMDSATTLYMARSQGYECLCLIFDYGQVHKREILSAISVAETAGCRWELLKIKLPEEGSALLGTGAIPLYKDEAELPQNVPPTYVPARNTIFLSTGISWAESIGAEAVFIGAHLRDALGYPDCRPAYFAAFNRLIKEATRDGMIIIQTPVIDMTKKEIIEKGRELGVPFELTWSCYKGGELPCGECGACVERKKGFAEAGIKDPLLEKPASRTEAADIDEVFVSIQGEGLFLGQRHLFVRFAGCNLACGYCDEKDNVKTGKRMNAEELLERVADIKKEKGPVSYVAITGGEPLLQADYLKTLFPELRRRGERIYLETNGTRPEELSELILFVDVISMDMKLPSATEKDLWSVHERFLKIARIKDVLVKVVIEPASLEEEFRKAVGIIHKVNHRIPLVIQPASPLPEDRKTDFYSKIEKFQSLASAELDDVRIIPQAHKMLGLK